MSKETKLLTDELTEIFKSLPSELKPDATNEFQHYSYNSIQQIKKIVGKELKKHNILFLPAITSVENVPVGGKILEETSGKILKEIGDKVLTTVHFTFGFVKGNNRIELESAGQAVDNQGKGLSKAKSDAIKRLFTDMFLIATSDEDDEKSYGQANDKPEKKEFTIKEPNAPLTDAQKGAIQAISKSKHIDKEVLYASIQGLYNKKSVSDLTKQEASKLIKKLQTEA